MANNSSIQNTCLEVQQICNQCFDYFVNSIPLDKANFPIMQITYTLWRKQAYRKLSLFLNKSKQNNKTIADQIKHQMIRTFYLKSQRTYLPLFIKKIENQMNIYCKGLQKIAEDVKRAEQLINKQQQSYRTIIQLGKAVWLQQLYLQLIEDLSRLPYLQIFSPTSTLYPRRQYSTNDLFYRTKQSKIKQIANKTGKNIFNKVISGVSNTVFTKAMLLRVNTLFGTFNPLAIGATFGVTQYLQYLNKKGQQAKVEMQFKIAQEFVTEKTTKLKQIYSELLNLIGDLTNESNLHKKQQISQKLKHLFLTILEESWLKIQQKGDEEGWTVVKLEETEQFQDLLEGQNN